MSLTASDKEAIRAIVREELSALALALYKGVAEPILASQEQVIAGVGLVVDGQKLVERVLQRAFDAQRERDDWWKRGEPDGDQQ